MADSCVICPHVRNSKGEMVESRLFRDLLHHLSDRGLAKEYYAVGTNDEFLQRVGDEAKFDENGEITIASLIKTAKIDINKEKVLKTLNSDIGAGVYSYNDAIGKLQNFNKESPFNGEYMATITSTGDGNYSLQVVEKTPENEGRLVAEISNRTLQDRLLYALRQAGVDVSFIEADERINGKYSTKNAKQTANGLYQLIQVAKGEHIDSTLAEEAGHFAVGALGKSPLVKRLEALLTPEVQKQVLGEDYDSKSLGANPAREVAGDLVGKALIGQMSHSTPGKHLLERIVKVAKTIFTKVSGDEVMKARLEADEIAERIAKDFLSPNFSGSVEQALATEETLYSARDSVNVATFKKVAKQLELMSAEMERIDSKLKKKFDNVVLEVTAGRDVSTPSIWSDVSSFDGLIQAVESMYQLTPEMKSTLEAVDFSNDLDFYNNMPRNAKALRVVQTYLNNSKDILTILKEAISGIENSPALVTGDTDVLRKLIYELDKSINGSGTETFLNKFKTKKTQFFLRFMERQYGSKYVDRAARKVWNLKRGEKLLVNVAADQVPISDYLDYLSEDISWYESLFASMSNSPDIVGQIADKTTKQANKLADDLTQGDFEELRRLKALFDSHKFKSSDMRKCYEVGRDGKLSGYFISPKLWGDWEKDFKEFRQTEFENFKAMNPNINSTTVSQQEKDMMWESYFGPLRKAWHRDHSTFNVEAGQYEPKDSEYHNPEFDTFVEENPDLYNILRQVLSLKGEIDQRMPEGSTRVLRAPQFRGTFTNEVGNRGLYEGTLKAIGSTLRRNLLNSVVVTSDDIEFGDENTYSDGEDLFETALSQEKEKLNRVPTFGIKLLPDTNELSTDFFHSMLSYAGMANTYAAMSQVVDTLEVGRETLRDRRVAGMATERERNETSKVFTRYGKFMEKQVYGIGYSKINCTLAASLAKISSSLSSLAAKVFLGGNVVGGIVNLGTGFVEILKEAGAGEFFTIRDWKKANKQYLAALPHNLWDTGKLVKDDKVSLLMTKFNMRGDNKRDQREWHTNRGRIRNFFGDSLMMPYKSGDHYMQSMAYLSILNGTTVYDLQGNPLSLWDAYQVVDIDPSNPSAGKKIELKDGVVFKEKSGIPTYNLIQGIISKIDASLAASSSSPFGGAISLTKKEQDYLDSKGYNLADMEMVRRALVDDAEAFTWNTDDESAFMDKAREINNRLHGIYNNQDKVALQQWGWGFGNMLLAMRGYALGMIERRFGRSKYNTMLGEEVEGSMNTFAKVIASTFTDEGGFRKTMKYIFLPIFLGDKVKADMEAQGFSAAQYYNMRRNFGDMFFIAFFALLKAITKAGGGGDDDDDDKLADEDTFAGLTYYFSSRLFREQSAFNIPAGMKLEKNSLLDLNPAGFSVCYTLMDMAKLGIGQNFADEENSDYFYQQDEKGIYEAGDSKFWAKFDRMFPYLRSWYVVEHPYTAMESYDYGQRLRQR